MAAKLIPNTLSLVYASKDQLTSLLLTNVPTTELSLSDCLLDYP